MDMVLDNMGKYVLHVEWDVNGEPELSDGYGHWPAIVYWDGSTQGTGMAASQECELPCWGGSSQCGCCFCPGNPCDCGLLGDRMNYGTGLNPTGPGETISFWPGDGSGGGGSGGGSSGLGSGPCHPGSTTYNPCDASCVGDYFTWACNPCAAGACNCESEGNELDRRFACVGETRTYFAPLGCPPECEACENDEWQWSFQPDSVVDKLEEGANGEWVKVKFLEPADVHLTVSRGSCCTYKIPVTAVRIELESVEFLDGHDVRRDSDGDPYAKPHWMSKEAAGEDKDRRHPVAYTRNSEVKVNVTFRVEPASLGDATVKVFSSPQGAIAGAIPLTNSGVLRSAEVTLPDPLHNKIDYFSTFFVRWQIAVTAQVADGETVTLGSCKDTDSRNPMYVTWVDPPTSSRRHTMLHIACKDAKGLVGSDQQAVIAAVWSRFQSGNIIRAQPAGDGSDVILHYYLDWYVTESTAEGLLKNMSYNNWATTVGDGHCVAWQDLFRKVLRVHDLPVSDIHIYPTLPNPAIHEAPTILVHKWKFVGQSSSYPGYPYKNRVHGWGPFTFNVQTMTGNYVWVNNEADVIKDDEAGGIPGQGTPNPLALFEGHSLNYVNGQFYDPSYGTGPFDTFAQWNNASLRAFGFGQETNGIRYLYFKDAFNQGHELECWGCPE